VVLSSFVLIFGRMLVRFQKMVGLKLTLNLERDHDDANQIHLDPSNDANQMMSITFNNF